jgi:hypothetical protein
MRSRVLRTVAAVFCSAVIMACAAPGPRVPIVNPRLIDEKAAKEQLIAKYCDILVKADRMGFEIATGTCRRFQAGEAALAGVKSSENGRYHVYLFKEKAGSSGDDHSVIAFYLNPGSELIRSCTRPDVCDVHVRNGVTRFGRTNVAVHGEPTVSDTGISIKFTDDRSLSFDLLFSYVKGNTRDGDDLIAVFLSAFPFLDYQ